MIHVFVYLSQRWFDEIGSCAATQLSPEEVLNFRIKASFTAGGSEVSLFKIQAKLTALHFYYCQVYYMALNQKTVPHVNRFALTPITSFQSACNGPRI